MRMLSANFWLALALWLVVFYHAQALEPSLHNKKPVDGLNDETNCSWDCTVLDSDFWKEMKTKIVKKKVVRFIFKYEKRVTEKCFSQTLRSSSENITEVWHVWWENKQLSVFTTASENVINLLNCLVSVKPHEEILTTCTLTPVSRTATEPTYYNGSSSKLFRSQLADLGLKLDNVDCNIQATDSLQPCIKIAKSAENSEGLLRCGGWPADVFVSLLNVFIVVFWCYFPAFLCLFSPKEVTEDSVRQIILDGASPVSLRSLVGNYLFSKEDTIWHRLRMFILRGVVLPFPFLVPAIFAEYLQQRNKFLIMIFYHYFGVSHLLQPRMVVCCVCYYVLSFYVSFFPLRSSKRNRPCLVCRQEIEDLRLSRDSPKGNDKPSTNPATDYSSLLGNVY